jgi:hypothetical protein
MSLKLVLKSITNVIKGEITVNPTDNFLDHQKQIAAFFECDTFKAIYAGSILDQTKSFSQFNFKNEMETIIIVPNKKQTPIAPTNVPSKQPNSIPPMATDAVPAPVAPAAQNIVPVNQQNNNPINPPQQNQENQQDQNAWNTIRIPSDSANGRDLYNVEQIHAAMLMLIPVLLTRPNFVQSVTENPNNIIRLMNNNDTRNSIREALQQANIISDSLRRNIPINITLHQIPVNNNQPQVQQFQPQVVQPEIPVNNVNANALLQELFYAMMNGGRGRGGRGNGFGNLYENFVDPNVGVNEDEDGGDGEEEEYDNGEIENGDVADNENETGQTELNDTDKENIKRIQDFTGCNEEIAKNAYLACHKNCDLAADMILSNRF